MGKLFKIESFLFSEDREAFQRGWGSFLGMRGKLFMEVREAF